MKEYMFLLQHAPVFFSLPIHLHIATLGPLTVLALVLDFAVLQPISAVFPTMKIA